MDNQEQALPENFNLAGYLQDAAQHSITTRQVSDAMGACKSTVDRWAEGLSTPHPFLFPVIFKAVERLKGEFNFAAVIQEVLDAGLPEKDICNEFKVSKGTLGRWASGATTPVPYAAGIIADRVRRLQFERVLAQLQF